MAVLPVVATTIALLYTVLLFKRFIRPSLEELHPLLLLPKYYR
jgi:hypothetical protein